LGQTRPRKPGKGTNASNRNNWEPVGGKKITGEDGDLRRKARKPEAIA